MLLQYSAFVLILTLYSSKVMSQNSSEIVTANITSDIPVTNIPDVPKPSISATSNNDSNDVQVTDEKVTTIPEMNPTRAATSKSPTTQPPLIHQPDDNQKSTSLNTKMNSSQQKGGKSGVYRQSASLLLSIVVLLGIKIMV
ncbi:hypothetical protein GWI33_009000 [Rhynchophorus ferrugineus]|uniref:Uncharacterized protein n=1 Tax=Rhynchophorus ferrugineus TaxID=354439 RepID=A0A834IHC9_RHYFE|nr:hypothetical protein GWI33_009000 [Rhynchophorus ferrugineus]